MTSEKYPRSKHSIKNNIAESKGKFENLLIKKILLALIYQYVLYINLLAKLKLYFKQLKKKPCPISYDIRIYFIFITTTMKTIFYYNNYLIVQMYNVMHDIICNSNHNN